MSRLADPAVLRPAVFFGLLALLLALEWCFPRREGNRRRRLRWPPNFILAGLNVLVLLPLPLAAVGTALLARDKGWGLFNATGGPAWLEIALAWLALDFAMYLQHRALHTVPLLWRLHRMHHSDIEFDVSTGLRFHPGEILLSMLWKMVVVLALGAPVAAVVLLELTLSSFSLWSHANLRYPPALERGLRWIFITPELHRAHHSVYREEHDSNYGSTLSLWDRLLRTWTAHPKDGHERMRIGINRWRDAHEQKLARLLMQPLSC